MDGHTDKKGIFHPHKNDAKSGVSSDQVEDEKPETEVKQSDAKKIKEQKS